MNKVAKLALFHFVFFSFPLICIFLYIIEPYQTLLFCPLAADQRQASPEPAGSPQLSVLLLIYENREGRLTRGRAGHSSRGRRQAPMGQIPQLELFVAM